VILRNDTKDSAEVTLSITLPDGYTLKSSLPHYRLSPGDMLPVEIEVATPSKKNDQISELTCHGDIGGHEFGAVKLRVKLVSGGLPQ
jgi:hypothetical protein